MKKTVLTFRFNSLWSAVPAAVLLSACGGGGDSENTAPPVSKMPQPTQITNGVPVVDPLIASAAEKIVADAKIQAVAADLNTPAGEKARFNQHMELVRIASPSRYEYRMAAEIHKRMLNEWGFNLSEVKTSADGYLSGSDVQQVDGLPVYNACVEIKGSYSSSPNAQSYRGQYPKVLIESHIDVVNPEVLPPETAPYLPIRLQSLTEPVVKTPQQLAAIDAQLQFDSNGRIIEDANYALARQWFANEAQAKAGGGVRIYVPGYSDAMSNTSSLFTLAQMFKKYKLQPVYDVWICGTSGEEGKGNLAGMKQLYGFEQDLGTGSNPLNFVANFGSEGGGSVNFTGSYRFEMKFKAPAIPGGGPNAVEAMAATIAKIADVKTPSELRSDALKTTYTVGQSSCEAPLPGSDVVPSCTLLVDMRSERTDTLNEVRATIEPTFVAGMTAENNRWGQTDGTQQAVSIEQMWYGLRPAFVNGDTANVALQAGWQAARSADVDKAEKVPSGSTSLNDNVPANTGVPTYNWSLGSNAVVAGTHAFWEWGTKGDPAVETKRIQRALTAVLIASGYHLADGSVIEPAVSPIGARTREVN
ncbi:peptidase M20 [Lampropedia puyangensis]|uniref:Peptidase M20 n=1 Tax=Lampropedia puyangensis TaxID=1330072 RepID=A0A4S8F290_9BURK|nr:peptidase M20 [Lampropedia puyangensis]THU00224.1 peptidase M20 [Lampropedia puyangensis]